MEYEDLSKSYEDKSMEIGERGLCISFLHSSPVYEMIYLLIGLEKFFYFFNDYKNETLRLLNIMSEKFCEGYKLYSSYKSVDAVVIPEDASTTLYSPLFFRDYIKPHLIKYCKIIKQSNKIGIIHACGHLKGLLEHFKNIDFDCLESVSQPPTGNVYVSEVKRILPGLCIMGGIPANVFIGEHEDFKKYVIKLIIDNKNSGNFILSSADSVPAFTKIRNLKSISGLINKFGKY